MTTIEPAPPNDAASTSPQPGPKRRWPWIAAVVLIIAAAGGAWYWSTRSAAPAAPPAGARGDAARPTPVVAAAATKGPIDVYVNALGTATPRNVVIVHPRVDGQLMSVSFTEGQVVKAGDLLAQIDPRPFEVMLTQAQGQMAKDQALLKNAQVDLERYRTLLAQDSIAKQQVDTQESLVRQYEATLQSDQGAIDSAKLQLTYSRVTAPIGGRVGLRQVDPGNVVHAADANGIVVITQLQPMTVVYPIPEDNVPQVMRRMANGQAIVVDAWDRDQKVKLATGRLLTVDNQIDTTTGTVKLKAEFPNDNLALFANQFVNVRMLVQTIPDATLVSSAGIQRGAPGTFVYVVKDDNTVTVRTVKLGPVQGEITSIVSGVQPGEKVVVDGADKLREGAKVELITPDARNIAPAAKGRTRGDRAQNGDKGSGTDKAAGADKGTSSDKGTGTDKGAGGQRRSKDGG